MTTGGDRKLRRHSGQRARRRETPATELATIPCAPRAGSPPGAVCPPLLLSRARRHPCRSTRGNTHGEPARSVPPRRRREELRAVQPRRGTVRPVRRSIPSVGLDDLHPTASAGHDESAQDPAEEDDAHTPESDSPHSSPPIPIPPAGSLSHNSHLPPPIRSESVSVPPPESSSLRLASYAVPSVTIAAFPLLRRRQTRRAHRCAGELRRQPQGTTLPGKDNPDSLGPSLPSFPPTPPPNEESHPAAALRVRNTQGEDPQQSLAALPGARRQPGARRGLGHMRHRSQHEPVTRECSFFGPLTPLPRSPRCHRR